MIHLRLLLAAVVVTFAAALALAAPARADDCSSQVHSIQDVSNSGAIQDCLRTGQTFGVAIGAVVAGAGVVIAIVGLPGRTPVPPPRPATPPQTPVQRREPETPPQDPQPQPQQQTQRHADPCFEQQVRLTTARTTARTAFSGLQAVRSQHAYLDQLWESTRETGYLSSVIDVAMMAGSLWAKPVLAAAGLELAKQAIAVKVAESIMKSVGKELAKDLIKRLESQKVDWSGLLEKAGGSRSSALYKDLIKDQLTQLEYDRAAVALARSGKVPDIATIEKEFSGPLSDLIGQTLSISSLASSTMQVSDKLAAIRSAMSSADDYITSTEEMWQNAVNETDLANDSLNRCRDLHGPAPA